MCTKKGSIILSKFVFLTTFDRYKTAVCIHCASVQLFYLRITGVALPLLSISRTPL